MSIKKYLHSCLLLEKNGKRILIDPGLFSFIEGRLKPQNIGEVDAILITHKHADHFDPAILKKFLSCKPTQIYTIEEIGSLLQQDGIEYERVKPGDSLTIEGFQVDVFDAPHGKLPVPVPDNVAFLVDHVLHPGDSFSPVGIDSCDVLALPIAGPWATLSSAIELVDRLHPRHVIPIHDAIIKDFMLTRIYELMLKPLLEEKHIAFHPLGLGVAVEV
ncbi:MBL fold metallo-hydrolase [Candidatus Uhrbacteria bacterium]|nr:MBL fold metallo-hydrolase [Candidatus Uhrbacteria bacterium]